MEKQKLPNANTILILSILSVITCCCYGVIGIVLAVVALQKAKKEEQLYLENPAQYLNIGTVNAARIIAFIGITLSAIYLAFTIYLWVFVGEAGIKDFQDNLMEKIRYQEELSQ
jgi:Trk-type K+ transport system membrane component